MQPFATLRQLRDGLAAGTYSASELADHYLKLARASDSNAFITIDETGARRAAQAADEAHQRGDGGPLNGLPVAHKDIFCTEGMLTTCASKMLHNFVTPYSATVVERVAAAGAVVIGKTNMDEFAMGSSNENSAYGAVHNPWRADCVPGGSSGGSAAAVGAGLVPAATGTDTGGSIRQPAAFCGITGLKPTYGRVSRYGMIAFASSLDQGGPMTRDAEDAALLLSCMAGFDPLRSKGGRGRPATLRPALFTSHSSSRWRCPILMRRSRRITFCRAPRRPPICPATMAYASGIGATTPIRCRICTNDHAAKVLARRSNGASSPVHMRCP